MDYKSAKMSMKAPITLLVLIALMFGFKMVYDNPDLLKFKNKKEEQQLTDKYIIETDMKYKTMQNDGGSYNSIYYEIDFNKNQIIKISESYHANLTGTPTTDTKTIYTKTIDAKTKQRLNSLIINIMEKEDINNTENYTPYVVKHNEEEKLIYNEDTIKEIKGLLNEIDNDGKKLLFTVTSNNLKCPSPTLYVYSDNTYEYYNTYSPKGEKVKPKKGEYTFSTDLILKNIGEFEDQGIKYIIEDSNNEKHGFNNYQYLEDFLNEIDIKIDTCIVSE